MPKQLINTVGLLVVLGVLALAALVVALPMYLQSLGIDGERGGVEAQNQATQAQVDALAAMNVSSVNAEAAALRLEIPDDARMDSVSAQIAKAAEQTKVKVINFIPGSPVSFDAATSDGEGAAGESTDAGDALGITGTVMIPIEFQVEGSNLASVLAFIDALREGPRLVGGLDVGVSDRGGSANANIKAFVLAATPGN